MRTPPGIPDSILPALLTTLHYILELSMNLREVGTVPREGLYWGLILIPY